jgi:hypothetical protein
MMGEQQNLPKTNANKYKNVPKVGTYVRHRETGNLGVVVSEDGELWIRPDIKGSPVRYPATQIYNWNIEQHAKRLPPGGWARVCYEANRVLCDIHPDLKRQVEWNSLHPNKRAEWIDRRVKFDKPIQLELMNAITRVLEESSD